jgi:hypothetical protein
MSNGENPIKILASILDFDVFETAFGILILYLVFRTFTEVYYNFEGKNSLGIILSIMLVFGSLLLIDGFARWKERYEEKREYEREQHRIKMESIKNPMC